MRLEFRSAPLTHSAPDDVDKSLRGRILLRPADYHRHYRAPDLQLLTNAEMERASRIAMPADVRFVLEPAWMAWWGHLAPDGHKANAALYERLLDERTQAALHYMRPCREASGWQQPRESAYVLVRLTEPRFSTVQAWLKDAVRRGHAPIARLWFDLVTEDLSRPRYLPTWDQFLSAAYAEAPMLCTSVGMTLVSRPDMPAPAASLSLF